MVMDRGRLGMNEKQIEREISEQNNSYGISELMVDYITMTVMIC